MTDIKLFQEILAEGKHTYIDPDNIEKLLKHLQEEVDEFKESRKPEEAADIIILLSMCANKMGIDLEEATWEKLRFNIKDKRFTPKESPNTYGTVGTLACDVLKKGKKIQNP